MEGINILATKLVLDYGIGILWWLIIGIVLIGVGVIFLITTDNDVFAGIVVAGIIISLFSLSWILTPVTAKIATIEDDVPYKYIEEHYKIKDKTDNLYTLIPLKEEK
jgi:uncharacterized Tic20 family protein